MDVNYSRILARLALVDTVDMLKARRSRCTGIPIILAATNIWQWYEVYKDPYHHIMRLNLYRFDGSPLPVLYLVSEPPQMLPKRPLHQDMPSLQNSPRASPIKKRSLALAKMISGQLLDWVLPVVAANPNIWLWVGAGFTGVGGFLYFCF